MDFLNRFFGFFGVIFRTAGSLIGKLGGGWTVLLVLVYFAVWFWPNRLLSEKLYDLRVAQKDKNWRYRGLKLTHLALMFASWLLFAAIWYGLNSNLWGLLVGWLVALTAIAIGDKIWG